MLVFDGVLVLAPSTLLLVFMFKFAMICHVDSFGSTMLAIIWINSDMGVCSQLVYSGIGS